MEAALDPGDQISTNINSMAMVLGFHNGVIV